MQDLTEEDMDRLRSELDASPEPPDDDTGEWSDPNSDGSDDDTGEFLIEPITAAEMSESWWDGYEDGKLNRVPDRPNHLTLAGQYADGYRQGANERVLQVAEGWMVPDWPSPQEIKTC